ncbi:A24 family peptidase C-terminal domain-containing protein [Nitrosopumilus adriaticus]|uniref:Putative archaeal preflagellin peptidase FlaK n=1 Tax=Nitrosopumilus adriaticus TaxID=1580092 RepID=A0A0D5C261_9ARCH|nr:A24 family peptidase C-terminal domain-containing protein [Nitrosopumilus adriaticus]AJW70879.1 putative archaeal preflagellin peptidase FlaK [Nitrosopumilus adriaticus]
MELFSDYHIISIGLALVMLGVASVIDVWKREIHDYFWIVFGVIGFLLIFLSPDLMSDLLTLGFALIIAPIVIIMWRIGFFGGADAFALIALAVIAPMATLSENPITPFTTLSNAVLLFVIPFIINVLRNTIAQIKGENIFEGFDETTGRKIIAVLMGYRAKNPKFGFSIEKTKKGKKKLNLKLHHAENQDFCTKSDTWITPGIPYLLLITGGFLIQIFYGDIILGRFLGL